MQTRLIHIRLPSGDYDRLVATAYGAGLSGSALATLILKAGVVALAANRGRFPMPLEFCFKEPDPVGKKPRMASEEKARK